MCKLALLRWPSNKLMIAECRLLIVEVGILPSQINNQQSSIAIQRLIVSNRPVGTGPTRSVPQI
jgi:hypothetical protein